MLEPLTAITVYGQCWPMVWGRPVGRRWEYGPGQHGKPENRPLYGRLGRLTRGFIRMPPMKWP